MCSNSPWYQEDSRFPTLDIPKQDPSKDRMKPQKLVFSDFHPTMWLVLTLVISALLHRLLRCIHHQSCLAKIDQRQLDNTAKCTQNDYSK